ncbi:MAG TPA: hypothetical protein VIY28_17375 [Pseudonocardiaceae bacterium]
MSKTVQIRNLDDDVHAVLRQRAAAEGLSLTQYLKRELTRQASSPTMAEWLAEADSWREHTGGVSREALDAAIQDMRADRP